MDRLRASAAFLCGVLCVAGLVSGVVVSYTARTLFDPSRFSQRAAASLAEPEVARVVAAEITDQIIAARRDLTAYRPILLGTVEYVVSSAPFRALVRRAAKKGHATLISRAGEELSLTVADVGVVVRNALSMYPEIASKLPEKAQVVLASTEEWPNGKLLVRVLRMSDRLRSRAYLLLGGGLGAGIAGVWLSRRRDRYLLRVGLGLAISAVIVGAYARFGGDWMAPLAKAPTGAELIRGLWPAFVGPLAMRMVILAAIGLVIVAGVTSFLAKIDIAAIGRFIATRLDDRPQRASLRIGRAFLFIVMGILIALRPVQSLEILMVMVGGIVFFIGVQELFSFIARGLPEARAVLEEQIDERRSVWPRVAVIGTMVLLLVAAGGYWLSRDDDALAVVPAEEMVDACNGHPELCERRLNDVCFAATHNSMAAADIATWMFPNQEKGIPAQLQDGVRGFLIDVHYGVPVGARIKTMLEDEAKAMEKYTEALGVEGVTAAMRIRERLVGSEETGPVDVYVGHGFCELGAEKLVDVLVRMNDFLVANPGEVVIIIIQDEGVAPADIQRCFAASGLEELVYRGAVTKPWPTLREMVESDERVLVFAENNAEGVPWYHLVWDAFQETPYRFLTPDEFSSKPGRGGKSGSLLLMNHWIETTPAPKPSNAAIVNAYDFLLTRARLVRRVRGMMPNLIAVDFYATGDLLRVVDTMNGVESPASAGAAR